MRMKFLKSITIARKIIRYCAGHSASEEIGSVRARSSHSLDIANNNLKFISHRVYALCGRYHKSIDKKRTGIYIFI